MTPQTNAESAHQAFIKIRAAAMQLHDTNLPECKQLAAELMTLASVSEMLSYSYRDAEHL